MKKPKKQTLIYYDFGDVCEYMIENKIWSSLFAVEFSAYLFDAGIIKNGIPFTLDARKLKHIKNEFSKDWEDAIEDLMKHFGEIQVDKNFPVQNIMTATFIENW